MKKIIIAALSALTLGLFASCQNGTQDVNITGNDSWQKSYVYNVTGTYTTYQLDTTTSKYVEKSYDVSTDVAMVQWGNYGGRNVNTYEVYAKLNYLATASATTYSQVNLDKFEIKKANGKYYTGRTSVADGKWAAVEITVEGDITGSKFTVTVPVEFNSTSNGTNPGYKLTFTRK